MRSHFGACYRMGTMNIPLPVQSDQEDERGNILQRAKGCKWRQEA